MDGFETNDKVLVIAATNRFEMVDKSLTRSGRFDIKVEIPLPSMETKILIFQKYLEKTKHEITNSFIEKFLKKYEHWSGADI
jgi:ATP-dependent 26S proteasome regulatory subunit